MPNKIPVIETVLNPDLAIIKPGFEGNICRDGRFLNYQKVPVPKLKDILKWQIGANPQRHEKCRDKFRLKTLENKKIFDKNIDKIVWLGHASFLVTLNGQNILLDPVFANIPLVKRRATIPFAIEEYNNIDYILISHAHYDHLDKKTVTTLAKLNPELKIYCGLNTSPLLKKWGIKNQIIDAAWYQKFPAKEIGLYFMPSLHWANRTAFDRNKRLWGSFIIQSKGTTVYFMGDSGYSAHFKEIGELFPYIDYAILGVGAYMPQQIMKSSHITPDEALLAYKDLNAKYLVPMHYATYNLTDEPYKEPLDKIERLFVANPQKLKTLQIGQILAVENLIVEN